MKIAAMFVCVLLLTGSMLLFVPSGEQTTVVTAQPIPEYQDASNGLPSYGLWVSKTEFFDLDEDGTGDVMVLGPRKGAGDRSLHVFKWDGNSWTNRSDEEGTNDIPHSSYGGYDIGDLDNDGDWDVGIGSHGAARVDAYLRSIGTNWIRSSQGLQASEDAWSVNMGDFNSDGNLDMLVAGFWERQLRVFAGDGNGNWVDRSSGLLKASSRSEAVFCDIDNDGDLDIVSTLGHDLDTDEVIWVYKGDGQGNWVNSSQGLPGSGNGDACAFGDFNNDGNVDIALSFWDSTVETYLGDGTGNWTESSVGLVDLKYVSLELVDLNGDKLDDLIGVEGSDPGRVHIYLRNENNAWTKLTQNLEGNAKGYRLDVEDFDHNGHPDIVAGFGSDNDVDYPGSVKVWKEGSSPTELTMMLTFPDGGEYLKSGSVQFIRWISAVPTGTGTRTVKLELSTSGSSGPWSLIEDDLPDTGIYQWTVPDEESGDCYIRITVTDGQGHEASDTSDNAFGIDQQAGGGGNREPHDPIDINSDAEWTLNNGVRSGTGTEADPYIIERWDIRGDDSTCISISGTRRYAIVRDCHLHNATGLKVGIYIGNVRNITIKENDIDYTHHGVHVDNSEFLLLDNRIVDIEARGVMVAGAETRMTAIGNYLRDTGAYGFNLGGSVQWNYPALLENNTISGAYHGIHLSAGYGTFRGNVVKNCYYGVHCILSGSSDKAVTCTFEDNVITRNDFGMLISLKHMTLDGGRSWAVMRGNRFERNIVKGLHLSNDGDYTIENNTVAMNPVGIDDLASGNRTYINNTIKFNLGGLIFRSIFSMDPDQEKIQLARVLDNDILNNAYYGIRNSYFHYPGEVSGNYYGGVPGKDGDLLDGNVGGAYRTSPNDPETPAVRSPVTVVDDGETVSIVADTTLDTSYFIRSGGSFDVDGAAIDLAGHWIAAKIGSYLNTTGGSISNGLTLSVATDNAVIEGTSFDNMAAAVSVYRATPFIGNITVTNENSTFDTSSTHEHAKFVLHRAGIYLFHDRSTILGGTLNTGGWFGIFAMNSEASVRDTSIMGNSWGVGVREGHMTLSGLSISLCSMAGITNDDDEWKYGNISIDIEGCDLQNNEIGIELAFGQIEGEGTPHDVFIGNNTIDGGSTGLYLEIEDALVLGNEVTNNGFHLFGSRVRVIGNTISDGTGLQLSGEALRLENNTFYQNSRGIHVYDSAPIVVNNDFIRNDYGVYAEDMAQPKLKFNNFEDNVEYGVYNDDSDTLVNATKNWWNSDTGPGGEGSGDGDGVSKYVAFDSWLLEESDHNGQYINIPSDIPTISVSLETGFFFRVDGRTRDPEGDIVQSVEIMLENDTYSAGWMETNGSWRDVLDRGGYFHAFDTFGFDGNYDVSVRCYDGNDYSPVATTTVTVDPPTIQDHAPIVIDGDEDFTEENGVRSGSGTETDPYLIERWNLSSMDSTAISLSNTASHVVILLCNIYGNGSNDGVSIANSRNVVFEDCRFIDNGVAIRVGDDSQVEIAGSLFQGSNGDDIYSRDSLVNVSDSAFRSEYYPVNLMGGPEVNLRINGSLFNAEGLFVMDLNLTFEGNTMIGAQLFGGSTMGEATHHYDISSNVFAHGVAGIWFNQGDISIERNLLVDHRNGWGVWGDRSKMTLRDNNIFGNRYGVENGDDSTVIDARRNWWGASNGPSGEGGGDGDSVSENVEFDPWLTEPYVVRENHAPELEIIEPDGTGDMADTSYTIEWNAVDEDDDTLKISLYYDTDRDPENGKTLIASGLSNSGSHHWDTSEMVEDGYYIYGEADDNNGTVTSAYSDGQVHVEHEEPNTDPEIEILEPDQEGEEADEEFTIEWSARDGDEDTLTIDLYFDEDTDPENGKTIIINGLSNTGTYDWDISEIDEGKYYIYGVADDDRGGTTSDYSSGTVTISHSTPPPPENHPPEITVSVEKADDYTYSITWTTSDEDDDALTIDLYYDTDTNPDNGKTTIISGLGDTTGAGSYDWDISDMEDGDYFIYAVAEDGEGGDTGDYSEQFSMALPAILPDFDIAFFQIAAASSDPGENVFIQVKVRNIGDDRGTGKLIFTVDKDTIQTFDLNLRSGKEVNHNVIWIAVEGNHTIGVEAQLTDDPTPENNVKDQVFVVQATDDEKKDKDDDFPVILIGLGIIILLVIVGVALISKRKDGGPAGAEGEGERIACPACGSETTYSEDENDHYCWECGEYVGEMEK